MGEIINGAKLPLNEYDIWGIVCALSILDSRSLEVKGFYPFHMFINTNPEIVYSTLSTLWIPKGEQLKFALSGIETSIGWSRICIAHESSRFIV
jgi:hypothetical protein